MILKKIIVMFVLSVTLFGFDKTDEGGLFKYSKVSINDNISLYAAEVNMKHYEKDEIYSIGIWLSSKKESDIDFAVGYAHPSYGMGLLSEENTERKDDTLVCFMNYSF